MCRDVHYGYTSEELSLNTKLEQMKNHHPISCFGTKDFFKKQYTVDEFKKNHKKWKDEF